MAEGSRSRVPVKLESAGDTHIGGRAHNEDSVLLRPDLNLYVVADGAGGQNAGNVASSLATTSIVHFFEQIQPKLERLPDHDRLGLYSAARKLSCAVQEANKEILQIASTSDRHHGMGTTVVAALFSSDQRRVHVAQVGDSRFYRLRDGRLELLTHDHSLANDVLEIRPDIEDARLMKLPQNVITNALGMSDKLRVSLRTHELAHGDRFLMCSDGLSDVVEEHQVAEVLGLEASCDERVRLLIDLAIEAHANDNVAVIILDCMLAAARALSATRPAKKLTPVKLTRIKEPVVRTRPRDDVITDESVPEIVLFDDGAPESTPMIHVVPLDSASDEMVDAVSDVIVPPRRRGGTSGREIASEPPDPRPARPTMAYSAFERGGAAAAKQGSSISAPRRNKPDGLDQAQVEDEPSRTGNTEQPPGPRLIDVAATRPAAPPPPAAHGARHDFDDETTIVRRSPLADAAPASTAPATTPRPAAAARPPLAPPDGSRPKGPTPFDGSGPKGPKHGSSPPRPRSTKEGPPPMVGPNSRGRLNLPAARSKKPLPPLKPRVKSGKSVPPKGAAKGRDKAPTPPPRELFDTNEFIGEDTVTCIACGSFIAKHAEICLYCGAPTGFVIAERKSPKS